MDIEINGEDFSFNPSCDYSYFNSFTTETGLYCYLDSDMCSYGDTESYIELYCEDGTYEYRYFNCEEGIFVQ